MNKPLISILSTLLMGAGWTVASATPAAASTLESRALSIAASKQGSPYKYGAAGPKRFDCSGLTYYAFKRAGKKLPRTAQSQYNKVHHVIASKRHKGDLVFIGTSSRSIYHVGIYAGFWDGYGWILDSPKPGRTVGWHKIKDYTAGSPRAYYGRP
jgi:cell wall-associated NlpC family hydrolase